MLEDTASFDAIHLETDHPKPKERTLNFTTLARSIAAAVVFAFASITVASAAVQHGPFNQNLGTSDVFGLKFGMSPDEALDILQEHQFVAQTPIRAKGPCEDAREKLIRDGQLQAGQQWLTGPTMPPMNCVFQIDGSNITTGSQATLVFLEDWPANPGRMRLVGIKLTVPTKTLADATSLFQHSLEKLGKPTLYGKYGYFNDDSTAFGPPPKAEQRTPIGLLWIPSPCWNTSNPFAVYQYCTVFNLSPYPNVDLSKFPPYYLSIEVAVPSSTISFFDIGTFTHLVNLRLKHENSLKSSNTSF